MSKYFKLKPETMLNLSFEGKNIYVGIDVHKNSWSIKVLSDHVDLSQEYFRDPSPQMLADYLFKRYPKANFHCAYEAGFSGFWIQEKLTALGINTIVIHPADIPTTDKEKRFKDDTSDCIKIAKCLRAQQLIGIYIPSKVQRTDRSFVRLRYKLASDIRKNMNRINSHLQFEGQVVIDPRTEAPFSRWSNRRITILEDKAKKDNDHTLSFLLMDLRRQRLQMLNVTRGIRAMSKSERYSELYNLLTGVPGVGCLTAMVWITEIGEASRFKKEDHLYSYLGLVPGTKSSGDTQRIGNITKRGNKILRTALVQSAWTSIRIAPSMTLAYENYISRMRPNKAIIRICKKLAVTLRAIDINRTQYEPKIN